MNKKQRMIREMERDANIHVNGRLSPKDREDVERVVKMMVNDEFIARFAEKVEDEVEKTMRELLW